MLLHKRIGVLLLNLGTPANCSVKAVRAYLKQFLNDPRVIELPKLQRWLLVNCLIVPFRAKKSAEAYEQIWQAAGSPLLINSVSIKDKLAQALGTQFTVVLGMRYGQPSIASALQQLQQAAIQKIIVIPLFPQYSSAATGSALQQVLEIIATYKVVPELQIKDSFFDDPRYIQALAQSIKPYIITDYDYVLMSYHGLPEQQMVHKNDTICNMQTACATTEHQDCYRAQCYQTSQLVAHALELPTEQWGVGFQSRLGRLPWIKPYTDELLVDLRQQGVSKLVVCCPSFIADCLETLEEIGVRAREQWHSLGGTELRLVPCLNAQQFWIDALESYVRSATVTG